MSVSRLYDLCHSRQLKILLIFFAISIQIDWFLKPWLKLQQNIRQVGHVIQVKVSSSAYHNRKHGSQFDQLIHVKQTHEAIQISKIPCVIKN